MQYIYGFTVALFLTVALIPLLIRFSAQLQLLDEPSDARKIHSESIPRSGGLAIAIGALLPAFFLLSLNTELKALLIAAAIIVVFGFCDDRFELDYRWKFLGQIIAVLVVMYGGVIIHHVPFMGLEQSSPYIAYPLTFFFLLGVTNAVNLSDGLDGLAGGTTLLSLVVITVFSLVIGLDSIALIALAVIGGLLGFLRFNTFPAKIFMGDAGSQFLGFITATLAIYISQHESSPLSPVVPLLILGIPILDTLSVMVIRIKEGRSPFSPDKNHLHHQLMVLGFRHYEAVAIIYLLQILLIISAYLLCYETDMLLAFVYTVFCAAILGSLSFARLTNWKFRDAVNSEIDIFVERRNAILRRLDWLYYHTPQLVEWAMSVFFLLVTMALIDSSSHRHAITAWSLAAMLLVVAGLLQNLPLYTVRLFAYSTSIFMVYLLAQEALPSIYERVLDIYLVVLAIFLMLAIRMTRREDFRLDTQDLLVLLLILIVPQLPFETLSDYSVGQIALRLAVLMYGCEFILARGRERCVALKSSSLASLGFLGLAALFFNG